MLHDMSHHIWILADHISDQGMGYHWVHFLSANSGGVQPRRFNAEFSAPCAQWSGWCEFARPSGVIQKELHRKMLGLGQFPPT
jgi:hypothetical protein